MLSVLYVYTFIDHYLRYVHNPYGYTWLLFGLLSRVCACALTHSRKWTVHLAFVGTTSRLPVAALQFVPTRRWRPAPRSVRMRASVFADVYSTTYFTQYEQQSSMRSAQHCEQSCLFSDSHVLLFDITVLYFVKESRICLWIYIAFNNLGIFRNIQYMNHKWYQHDFFPCTFAFNFS